MPVVRRGHDAFGARHKSSILRKLLAYADARTSKRPLGQWGWRTFRVLFLTETAARAQSILDAVYHYVPTHADLFLAWTAPHSCRRQTY